MAAIRTFKVGRFQSASSLQSNEFATEIDNHKDITVLVSNCLPIHDFGRSVDVFGWDASAGVVECPPISWAIENDHLTIGQVYMLVYHQAIH